MFKTFFMSLILCLILVQGKSLPAYAEEGDDAYDPFIDYNEYEIEDEEEADVNFFRHGRFLTAGFTIGQRSFTEGMRGIFKDDLEYGLYLSYFFDLRFALQFGYMTGSHAISVKGGATQATGTAKINGLSIDLKYYLNTQNVTKGLATLNPYFIGGFTSFSRESLVDGQPEFSKDSAMGFDVGAGIEIPMMHNKMYFGAQGLYQLVSFPDENSEIILNNGVDHTGKFPSGDFINIMAIMGVNF
jgi:hypothetical protein